MDRKPIPTHTVYLRVFVVSHLTGGAPAWFRLNRRRDQKLHPLASLLESNAAGPEDCAGPFVLLCRSGAGETFGLAVIQALDLSW